MSLWDRRSSKQCISAIFWPSKTFFVRIEGGGPQQQSLRKEDREKSGPVSYFYVAMTPGGLGVYENRGITEAAEAVITDRHRWAGGGGEVRFPPPLNLE